MKRLNLRYHHLMCCYTFTGVGYSEAFTANMKRIVSLLYEGKEELELCLVDRCDDLCVCCPHNFDGHCETETSVLSRDQDIASYFGLKEKTHLSASEYRELVLSKQKHLRNIGEICRECIFSALCQRVLDEKNKK